MAVPSRPIFQNGQRLTAERLNAALDFLRDAVRRLALAPLSAGVAAGLELGPTPPQTSDTVSVRPGVGIDGRGRLMILEFGQSFTGGAIESLIGGQLRANETVEIRMVLDENAGAANACGPNTESAVLENSTLQIVRSPAIGSLPPPPINCVDPWGDLDAAAGSDCGIALGHVMRTGTGQLLVQTPLRQAVSAQLGRIRNANGNQAMIFSDSVSTDRELGEVIRAVQPFVADGPVVVNNVSTFRNTSRHSQLFGFEVQATHIGDNETTSGDQVAGIYLGDRRVFVVAGGAGPHDGSSVDLPVRHGGVISVQCRVHPNAGTQLFRAGVPLSMDVTTNGEPVVREFLSGFPPLGLIGLSAGPSVFVGVGRSQPGTMRVVPVATSGLVPVSIAPNSGFFPVGTPLTFDSTQTSRLVPSTNNQNILARAAQTGSSTKTQILAWVVHPPQNLTQGQPVIG